MGEVELVTNSSSFSTDHMPQKALTAKLIPAVFAHAWTSFPWLEYFICLINSYKPFKSQFKFCFSEKPSLKPFQARLVPLYTFMRNLIKLLFVTCLFLPLEFFFF